MAGAMWASARLAGHVETGGPEVAVCVSGGRMLLTVEALHCVVGCVWEGAG